MTADPTHYETLGVPPTASAADIRQAFVAEAHVHHPDREGGDAARMRALNEAWAVLGDPVRRRDYDAGLEPVVVAPPTAAAPPVRTDAEDLLADLADDRPIGGVVRLPGWLSLLPPAVFVLSVLVGMGSLLFVNRQLLAVAIVLFLTSCVLFLVSPFVALLVSRSRTSGPSEDR